MTVENCILWLEAYRKQAENPVNLDNGTPLTGTAKTHVIKQSKHNYEMMKKHILTSKKFEGHPIIEELSKAESKPKQTKKGK